MSFVSEINTSTSLPSELGLFADPPNQVAVQKLYFSETRPMSSLSTDGAPLEFCIPGQGAEYLDLRRSRLYVKAKITKADGTALGDGEKIGISNLCLAAMFNQVDIYANGKLITQNANNYPWKAYFKVLLSTGTPASKSQLQTQLYYPDVENFDDMDPVQGVNKGLLTSYVFTQQSRAFDLEGPLYADCFQLDKYLINGVDVQLRLFRSRPEFVLVSADSTPDYKLTIVDAVFKACKVKVDPAIILNHTNTIANQPARYNYLKTDIKMNTIPSGSSEFVWDNMWNNVRPSKVYIAFVKQAAMNGSYAINPFNFQHFNLSEIVLYVNGEPTPIRGMPLDFGANQNYVTPLCNLYQSAEKWCKDDSLIIDRETFSEGYAIYAFDLDPTDLGMDYINLVHSGNVRLYARFGTVTTETISAIAYCESPSVLLVDHSREVRVL